MGLGGTPAAPENKLDTLGLFSQDSSISIGSKYGVRPEPDSRTKGKQFSIVVPKEGNLDDSTFAPFTSIKVGDKYVTAEQMRRAYEKEKRAKILFPGKPFIPSSPAKVPTGAGTIYGTFKNFPYMKSTDDYDKKVGRPTTSTKKNFLTCPAKSGHYAAVGVNIGGKAEGVSGEFSYTYPNPHPFPMPPRPKSVGDTLRPFTPSSPPKKGTYGYAGLNLAGTVSGGYGEYKYESDGIFTRPRQTSSNSGLKPFLPSSPSKAGTGIYGTVGNFPSYMDDPLDEKRKAALKRSKEEREKIIGPTFRPSGVPKSIRTPSIAGMKANYNKGF